MSRITAADVQLLDKWLCTCPPEYRPKDGSDCPHVRAAKEAVNG